MIVKPHFPKSLFSRIHLTSFLFLVKSQRLEITVAAVHRSLEHAVSNSGKGCKCVVVGVPALILKKKKKSLVSSFLP